MTAAWQHLTSPWGLLCLGVYAVVAVVILAANYAAHRKPTPRADVVNWMSFLPPVPPPVTPPFTQTVASADWFWDIPSDCLGDDAIHALCDDIERRNFR